MTQTYYSPFFPDPGTSSGTKGSTVPIVTPEEITDIKDRVDELELGGGGDSTPPAAVTGLALSSNIVLDTDGSQIITLVANWDASGATDLAWYDLDIQENSGVFIQFMAGKDATEYFWKVRANRLFGVRIRAVDNSGNRSTWSTVVSATSAADTTPPATVSAPSIVEGMNSFYLSWTNPADADLEFVEIYENTVNNSGTANRIATVNAAPLLAGSFSRTGIATGGIRYYWMKARDTSGNYSVFSSVVSGAAKSINPGDFGATIKPVETVTSLPAAGTEGRIVYLTTDDKIYRDTGSGWTTASAAADLTGQLTNAQIADLAAAKLTGQITTTQITDGAITTPKVLAGAIISDKIAAGAVTTAKLWVTGAGDSIIADSGTQDITAWNHAGNTIVADSTSPTGYALESITAGPGVGGTTYSRRATLDATRNYHVRIWAKNVSGTAGAFLAVIFYDKAGAFLPAASGWPAAGSYNYFGLVNQTPPSTWTEYTISFGPNEGPQIPTGAAFVSVAFLPNYTAAGTQRFTGLKIIEKSKGEMIVDGTLTADKIQAGSITGDRLTAGTITAAQIATGSITTNKMLISGDNLIPNSDFGTADWTNWSRYSNSATQEIQHRTLLGVPANAPTSWVAKYTTTVTSHISTFTHENAYEEANSHLDGISVKPGEEYFVSVDVAKAAAHVSEGFYVYAYFFRLDGSKPSAIAINLSTPTTSWATYTGAFTVPADVTRCWLYFINFNQTTAGALYWTNLRCWRKASGNLIVNGAITADKIAAGTITATQIAGGTITGDKFNTGTSLPGTITVGSTGVAIGTVQQKVSDAFDYVDTRSVNSPPSFYRARGVGRYAEFKTATVVGVPSVGTGYAKLVTEVHYSHISGGPVYQYAQDGGGRNWNRYSTDEATWGTWTDTAGQVNASTTQILPGLINISGATTLASWRNGGDTTKIEGGSIAANTISANKITIGNRGISFRDIVFSINAAGTTLSWTGGIIQYTNDLGNAVYNYVNAGSVTPGAAYAYISWAKPALANQVDAYTTSFTSAGGYLGNDNTVQVASWFGGSKTLVQNFGGTIIDGSNITTGTITANKLSVASLDAISANVGLLRTASSGARVEIESNQIRVYDASNVMRVRMGVW